MFGQRTQLWWDVPIADSFDLLREIYDRPRNDWAERLKQISAALELDTAAAHAPQAAEPGPAHAGGGVRFPAAPAPAAVPGRAHHRPGRGEQAGPAEFPQGGKPPGGYHHPAHHPRYGGYAGPVQPRHGVGARETALRRRAPGAAPPVRYGAYPALRLCRGGAPRRPFRRGASCAGTGMPSKWIILPPGCPPGTCWTGSAGREPCGR